MGKSTGKKRNRSKQDSTEIKSKKKSKTMDSNNQEPSKPQTCSKTINDNSASPNISELPKTTGQQSTPVNTPKGKLNFDDNITEGNDVDKAKEPEYLDAPLWAQELITKLRRVEELAGATQKTISGVASSNANLSTAVNNLVLRVDELEKERILLRNENVELHERLLLLEFHQRRNNLIIDGIPESEGFESGRDCYNKIMDCLSYSPNLDINSIRIDRCHRLGARQKYRSRSIIARFNWYGDLMDVLANKAFFPSGVYVSEDFPEEWQERRKLLRPILNSAKKSKYKDSSFLTRDKLIIDGKQYTVAPVNNLSELPPELTPSASCEVRDSNTIAFLGPHSVFSNFHSAKFTESGVRYNCAEQMIQAEKAALFKDVVAAQRIMKATSPYKMKEIGGKVRNFDKQLWQKESKKIVTRAVRAKFHQNKALSGILKNTGTIEIVEASRDSVWGIGLHLRDPKVLDKSAWHGKGLMSEILSQVRSTL